MKLPKPVANVYREFSVGVAIAWFSAGVIAPLFSYPSGQRNLFNSVIAVIASTSFLRLAIKFNIEK